MPNRIALLGVSGPTAAAPPAGFSPASIYGLELWVYQPDLDYSAGTWVDQSGNSRNFTQGTAGFRPTTAVRPELNGKTVVVFDGSDDRIDTSVFATSQPFSFVLIARDDDNAGQENVVDGTGGAAPYPTIYYPSADAVRIYAGSDVSGVVTRTRFHGLYGLFNGASSSLRQNVAQLATGNPGAAATAAIRLGISNGATVPFGGDIPEFIMYRGVVGAYELCRLWNEWVAADRYNIPVTFNPTSISTCQFWVRSDDLGAVDSAISSWADQSGNGRNAAQGTGANQPLVKMGRNGRKCALFDGSNDVLITAGFTLNQPTTVFMVTRQVSWSLNDQLLDGVNDISMVIQQAASTPELRLYAGSNGTPDAGLSVGSWGILSAVYNSASSTFSINGGTRTTSNIGTNNAGGVTLGARANLTAFSHIEISEVIIYSGALTAAQQQQVEGYLSNKYAINAAIRPFDPLSVPLCQRWYNAETTDQTVDGSAVTTMYDRAGSGLHVTQSVAGSKPTYRATGGPTGGPAVDFDGGDELLQSPAGAFFTGTPHTYIAVVKNDSLGSTQKAAVGVGSFNVNGTFLGVANVLAGNVGMYLNGVGGLNSSFLYSSGEYSVIAGRHAATPLTEVWADGVKSSITSAGGSIGPSASSAVGSGVGGGYWDGNICEVIVYNTNISDSDLASVMAWLSKKYNIGYKAPNHSTLSANLAMWFDASQLTGLSDGGAVSSWTDMSGNGRHATQGTGANQPTYQTLERNGRPVIRFDGINDELRTPTVTLAQPNTIFVVAKNTTSPSDDAFIDGLVSGARHSLGNVATGGTKWRMYAGSALSSTRNTDTNWHIHGGMFNTTASKYYIDNVVEVTGDAGSHDFGGLVIGALVTPGACDCDIAEIIVYDSLLSEANFRSVLNYLIQKYNQTL